MLMYLEKLLFFFSVNTNHFPCKFFSLQYFHKLKEVPICSWIPALMIL